jgi:hypothetical protein
VKPYLAVLPFVLIYSTVHKVWPLMNDEQLSTPSIQPLSWLKADG